MTVGAHDLFSDLRNAVVGEPAGRVGIAAEAAHFVALDADALSPLIVARGAVGDLLTS